jgi:hypothetical protein
MTPEGGTWEQWMAALEELDQALPERAHPSCPNCGRRELRAQYIGVPTDRIGYAAIWCDHCHWGRLHRPAEIPAAAVGSHARIRWRGSGGALPPELRGDGEVLGLHRAALHPSSLHAASVGER